MNESPAPLPPGPDSTRVDRWLWAVRLVKTRADAAQAGRGGHEVRVRLHGTTRIVEVGHVIEKRVSAPVAVRCYADNTPEAPPEANLPVIRRDRGAGRPTKRDRRVLDRLRTEFPPPV
ncbi:RNA-binding S4 domain-containing protein [Nocardiopsis tropica]|nr:RNA-binding S4 domain-containing protein [Nocardiopsis tropica]